MVLYALIYLQNLILTKNIKNSINVYLYICIYDKIVHQQAILRNLKLINYLLIHLFNEIEIHL